ncbi:hypothetical protein C1N74_04030 [Microbacterium sp. SGAir0570]|nr:hypothetical protein C1N74_04030 [Microbacterium sp. SGAir0570]
MSTHQVRSQGGITRSRHRTPDQDYVYERIAALINRGHSDLSTARALGICNRTVQRYRERRGIPNMYERTAQA